MKRIIFAILIFSAISSYSQNDVDVIFLKNGTRLECTIQKIQNDSIYISQFSKKSMITTTYPRNMIAVYLINNHYTTPGDEVLKAAGNFTAGISLFVIGGTLGVVGYNDSNRELILAGAGFIGVGSLFLYNGFASMRRAGKKFNKVQLKNDRLIYKL
nr:hypothetical protein [Bacteroidota bacterium]